MVACHNIGNRLGYHRLRRWATMTRPPIDSPIPIMPVEMSDSASVSGFGITGVLVLSAIAWSLGRSMTSAVAGTGVNSAAATAAVQIAAIFRGRY
jgi:small-conductance mechanosensitive channel